MKKILLLASLVFISFTAFGQDLNVIAGGGDFNKGLSASLSSTLGESAVETLRGSGAVAGALTQGFQQNLTGAALTALEDDELPVDADMGVFPNPTDGLLNIKLTYSQNTDVEIFLVDMRGVALIQKTVAFEVDNVMKLDMASLPAGMYVLRVATTDGKVSRTFKVEKQ